MRAPKSHYGIPTDECILIMLPAIGCCGSAGSYPDRSGQNNTVFRFLSGKYPVICPVRAYGKRACCCGTPRAILNAILDQTCTKPPIG